MPRYVYKSSSARNARKDYDHTHGGYSALNVNHSFERTDSAMNSVLASMGRKIPSPGVEGKWRRRFDITEEETVR